MSMAKLEKNLYIANSEIKNRFKTNNWNIPNGCHTPLFTFTVNSLLLITNLFEELAGHKYTFKAYPWQFHWIKWIMWFLSRRQKPKIENFQFSIISCIYYYFMPRLICSQNKTLRLAFKTPEGSAKKTVREFLIKLFRLESVRCWLCQPQHSSHHGQ